MLPLSPYQAGIDHALATVLLVFGSPHLCRRVAPPRRLLEACLSVGPLHTAEPHHDPMRRADDPRHAVAAACAPDPGRLSRRRRRTGHVLWLCTRPPEPGPDPGILAPCTCRTPPRVEVLEPGRLWAQVFSVRPRGWDALHLHVPPRTGRRLLPPLMRIATRQRLCKRRCEGQLRALYDTFFPIIPPATSTFS